ncbi:MAG: hypothetical protein C0490_05520 [Marivirga sp.]|nr:hypothetical protein [Marivirga sp.]
MIHLIHLSHRADRMAFLLKELSRQRIRDYKIWPGIETTQPSLGIAMAHQQIVKWAAQENLPEVIIAEDDVQFTTDGAFTYYLQNKPSKFDLYLGGITYGQLTPDGTVNDFAGAHFYTIHRKFYNIFLSQDGNMDIDRSLKNKGKFVVFNPMIAIQRNGFSDNRKQEMDYSINFKDRALYGAP